MSVVRASAGALLVEHAAIRADVPSLVTIPHVPIALAGEEWPLSTGPHTFTWNDLVAAAAAPDDPAIHNPRLKLGHGQLSSGWPAFGRVDNMAAEQADQTLYGDLVGIPRWLAEVLPSAYPSRSIEGGANVKTVTGHEHLLVITHLALLGVELPGITTLADLEAYLTAPEVVDMKIAAAIAAVVGATEVEDVRRSFYDDFAQDERYWWWIRSVQIEPAQVIAEDEDTGDLYRVPYTLTSKGVEWSEPVAIEVKYVDAQAVVAQITAAVIAAGRTPSVWAGARASREGHREKEDRPMARTRVRAETDKPPADPESEPHEGEDEDGEEEATEPVDEEPTDDEEEDGVPTATVAVDAEVHQQTQERLRYLEEREAARVKAERIARVDAAIHAGKTTPARREQWVAAATGRHAEESLAELEARAPGLAVPLGEKGKALEAQDQPGMAGDPGYPREWLSAQERAVVEAHERAYNGARGNVEVT